MTYKAGTTQSYKRMIHTGTHASRLSQCGQQIIRIQTHPSLNHSNCWSLREEALVFSIVCTTLLYSVWMRFLICWFWRVPRSCQIMFLYAKSTCLKFIPLLISLQMTRVSAATPFPFPNTLFKYHSDYFNMKFIYLKYMLIININLFILNITIFVLCTTSLIKRYNSIFLNITWSF